MPFIKKNYEINWENNIRKISNRNMAEKYFTDDFKNLIQNELFYLNKYVSDDDNGLSPLYISVIADVDINVSQIATSSISP